MNYLFLLFAAFTSPAVVAGTFYDDACKISRPLAMAPAESAPAYAWDYRDGSLWRVIKPEWDVRYNIGGRCVPVDDGSRRAWWYYRIERISP